MSTVRGSSSRTQPSSTRTPIVLAVVFCVAVIGVLALLIMLVAASLDDRPPNALSPFAVEYVLRPQT
jgi:hypothetical protein